MITKQRNKTIVLPQKHTATCFMEFCEVINEEVHYKVCAELCRRQFKCAKKWKVQK